MANSHSVQIVAGLDEGVASMRAGGVRRIYIPGNLSFPKGLASGPGRCAVYSQQERILDWSVSFQMHSPLPT